LLLFFKKEDVFFPLSDSSFQRAGPAVERTHQNGNALGMEKSGRRRYVGAVE
jgi:hypothetical protein